MGRPSEWLRELARRTGIPAASSSAAGIATWVAAGRDNAMTITAAVCVGGLAAGLPKIFESIYKRRPANIKAKGEARAKVIDAETRQLEAKAQKIKAISEAKCATRRAAIEAKMLRFALKSGKVNDAIALLNQQKPPVPPGKEEDTGPLEDGKSNIHSIRPLDSAKPDLS
jgi:hypothetical protein